MQARSQNFMSGAVGVYYKQQDADVQQKRATDIVESAGVDTKLLYAGIEEYQKRHSDKIHKYDETYDKTAKDDPLYFRKKFLALVQEKSNDTTHVYRGGDKKKKRHPEKAATSLEELLGKDGVKLYKLALEEERFSKEYMNAVVNKSTHTHRGEKWEERFVDLVGGVSGSGKSYAAQEVVATTVPLLNKSQETQDNQVVTLDGEKFRDVSQMRKLAIKLAISKEFTGINDLSEQDKLLDQAKTSLQNFMFHPNNKHSIVMPETFSKVFFLDITEKAAKLKNTKVVYSNVLVKKETVKFLGPHRAFKTDWDDVPDYSDLNSNKGVPESKLYQPKGYFFGVLGSRRAGHLLSKKATKMCVINDLILLKPDPQNPTNWVPASAKDQGVIKVSERVFEKWQQAQIQNPDKKVSLPAFIKDNPLPPEVYFSDIQPDFVKQYFPHLPSLVKLIPLCKNSLEKFLGGFLVELLRTPPENYPLIASNLSQALQTVGAFQLSKDRDALSNGLKKYPNLGALLDHDDVIDKQSGKMTHAGKEIIKLMTSLQKETMAMTMPYADKQSKRADYPSATMTTKPALTSSLGEKKKFSLYRLFSDLRLSQQKQNAQKPALSEKAVKNLKNH